MATKYGTAMRDVSNRFSRRSSSVSIATNGGSTCADFCSRRCRLRIFKNKGAVLVLVLSFCGLCVFHFMDTTFIKHKNLLTVRNDKISPAVVLAMCVFFYPIFGWLADVRYGRYKVIKWSLWITFVALILFCIASAVLSSLSHHPKHLKLALKVMLYILLNLGVGGFLANIVQFGIDQMTDASSSEISSFIRWSWWVWSFSAGVVHISHVCLCPDYESLVFLLLPTLIAFAICLYIFFDHWLVKEPTSENPFRLIFSVLRYAVKNKHPRLRSAFTYWEDKRYHRIDLAMTKYGGPYTTEQVEDVKTFFRITSVIIACSFFTSIYNVASSLVSGKIFYHLRDDSYQEHCEYSRAYMKNCFHRRGIESSGNILIVVGIPLFEFVFYPFLKKCFHVTIMRKLVLGTVLVLLSMISCTAIEFTAQHMSGIHANATCPFTEEVKPSSLSLDYRWMVIKILLSHFAHYVLLTSATEFVCAQTPYSMKGFVFGFAYGSVGFFAVVGYVLMLPVQILTEKKLSYRYGCLFWYLVISLGILVVSLAILFVAFKCYRKRRRDDNEHNEQIFAENYYTQYHDSTEPVADAPY